MRALIVEDSSLVALVIEDTLRDLGYMSFAFATSCDDAIVSAEVRFPDLITADVRLAPGNGVEAVRTICSKQPIPVVYVIATGWEVWEQNPDAFIVPAESCLSFRSC